jgi:hypothetical protein
MFIEHLAEVIGDKLVQLYENAESIEEFEKEMYGVFSHRITPGIMQMYECSNCKRLSVFARASDRQAVLWYQLDKVTYPQVASSLTEVSAQLEAGKLERGWQESIKSSE